MRLRRGLAALSVGAAALAAGELWAQDATRSVWDGVYSAAQAERGQAAYAQNCGVCHGAQLAGTGEAKPLAGPEFLSTWNGLTMADLFDRTRTTMPMNRPASLSRETYAEALAYILKFNGFPAGPADLDRRSEYLAGIRIDAYKPAAAATGEGVPAAARVDDPPNSQPNPYVADTGFFKLPAGRTMGSTSGVAVDSRGHIWIAERCGANNCAGSQIDPIMEFDAQGNFIKAFGGGMLVFPHGLFIDSRDHIWVTDARSEAGKGAQVFAFDNTGKLILALGKAGVSAEGPDTFSEPSAVTVSKDGVIFVADGHTQGKDPQRIVKFDPTGRFIKQWGVRGSAPGQIETPHTLALDSRGRVFVGDRWNNRISIFDQDGKLLGIWTQFGRPSGVYIDRNDIIYVADSESREPQGYGHHPGWKRGIRIGSARTGRVDAYIPDTAPDPDRESTSGPEGIWADGDGVVYGAQVFQKAVVRYTRRTR